MLGVTCIKCKSLYFNASGTSLCRIFSDVAGDITVSVDGQSFLLHKVPHLS
jgi:hypothetical protein